MSGQGHNSVAADQLRLLIERVERLAEERKGISDDIRDVFTEAKSNGFDVKTMRKVIAERKKTADQRAEEHALAETYLAALGML